MKVMNMSICNILLLLLGFTMAMDYEEALSNVGSDGLLVLTNKNWKSYVKNENFGLFLFITASDPRVGCALCGEFDPMFKDVAREYWNSLQSAPLEESNDEKSQIIFALADLPNVRELFEAYQIRHVPRMFYYEPGKGPNVMEPSDSYQFMTEDNIGGYQHWLISHTPNLSMNRLTVIPRVNKGSLVLTTIALAAIIVIGYYKKSLVFKVVKSKLLWSICTLSLIILFISGYMYNQIRNTPQVRVDKDGNTVFFQPGNTLQLRAETQIVSILYGVLTLALLALVQFAPYLKDSKVSMWLVIFSCIASMLVYSGLVGAYVLKSPAYPFHLFKLF